MKSPKLFIIIILLVVVIIAPAFGQIRPMKVGEVSPEDVKMKVYAQDSSASAVILYDYSKVYFKYGYDIKIVYERHCVIKILKKEGYEYANVEIPFLRAKKMADKEKITDIQGMTYNEENGVIQASSLKKETQFKEKVATYFNLMKFTMPNVKEGSVIEYTYKITSDFFYDIKTWEFEKAIPVRKSIYHVTTPAILIFEPLIQNCKEFTVNQKTEKKFERGVEATYYWEKENINAYKEEDFTTNIKDYIAKIDFYLVRINLPDVSFSVDMVFRSWEEFATYAYYGTRKAIDDTTGIKEVVQSIIKDKTEKKEQLVAIYDYLRKNIKSVPTTDVFRSRLPKKILESKKGTTSEINLLLINLLREAEIYAFPVFLSTRANGKINKEYPFEKNFNYCVAYASYDSLSGFILDASDSMRIAGMLPTKALNGEGLLVVSDSLFSWIPLQNNFKASKTMTAFISISSEGKLKGEISTSSQGYAALELRKEIKNAKDEDDSTVVNKTLKYNEFTDLRVIHENINDYEKPLKSKLEFDNQDFAEVNDQYIYFNPLLYFQLKENPLKATARKYPLDFIYAMDNTYYATFTIPPNYEVEETPQPIRLEWQDKSIKYEYLVQKFPDRVQIVSKLNINKAIFSPEEYSNLRDTFAKIVAKQNEQIVLKKK
jgi:hypothetical protein